jgi:hypothetical protein
MRTRLTRSGSTRGRHQQSWGREANPALSTFRFAAKSKPSERETRDEQMARTGIISAVYIWLFFSFAVPGDTSQIKIQVTNPLNESREDETVSVDLETLPYQPQSASVYSEQLKKFVLCQTIDNDGDGKNDELIFQSDFGPGQTQLFSVSESNSVPEVNVVERTNATFVP